MRPDGRLRGWWQGCPICDGETAWVGQKTGAWRPRPYGIRTCRVCGFSFVEDPDVDFGEIYGPDYYCGLGADPAVDYVGEIADREGTVRTYEWRGVHRILGRMLGEGGPRRVLDYGCGHGGLVWYLRSRGVDAWGFEEGWIAEKARTMGVPLLSREELEESRGSFDAVAMVEVLEHVPDPVAELRRVRALLRPGGALFLTTGNSAPFRGRMLSWRYVVPEVHVSYFTPLSLWLAIEKAGLRAEHRGWMPGFEDVIRFKVLKNLGVRRRGRAEALVPWRVASRVVDARYGVTAMPVGWKREAGWI